MKYLVTGTAGFIGFHVARRLLALGHEVAGIDGVTPYYDIALKLDRHALLEGSARFSAHQFMLEDAERLTATVAEVKPDVVIHLAAQAGIRYSIENPAAYIQSNIVGTFNLLQACRQYTMRHLLIASTSSVYGANSKMPFAEIDRADHPISLYAATKKATEDIAHSYSHLFHIPVTMLRFFTVYGPWGRPDMALFKFVKSALAGEKIDVYNRGQMERDFTYINDLVDSIVALSEIVPQIGCRVGGGDTLSPVAPMRVVNIGGGNPVPLQTFIEAIEDALGMTIECNYMDMQAGDVSSTAASGALLESLIGKRQWTSVKHGVRAFVCWYREHYHR